MLETLTQNGWPWWAGEYPSFWYSVPIQVTYFDFSIPIALMGLGGIKWRKRTGRRVNRAWMQMPTLKFSNWSEDIRRIEARLAPKKELKVAPMLFKDMKREKSVPSIPGSHNWPESTKNGINLLNKKGNKLSNSTCTDMHMTKCMNVLWSTN